MKVKKLKKKLKSTVELKEILKNPSPKIKVPVYTEEEVEQRTINPGDDTVKKKTLSQRLDELTEIVTNGFKQVNTRLDRVENRLDNVEKRLDNVEVRLDNVEKRLDYNNLKQLPK